MADEPKKTGTGDGTESKPGEQTGAQDQSGAKSFTQADIDKAISIGMGKGVDKGKKEAVEALLGDLGVSSLDDLKGALKKGNEAIEKIDASKSKHEQALEKMRTEFEARDKKRREETEPILKEALDFITEAREEKLFQKLKIKDPEMLRALMLLHEPEEGESKEDHVKRIVKMRPELASKDENPLKPTADVGDAEGEPGSRHAALAKRFSGYLQRPGLKAKKE